MVSRDDDEDDGEVVDDDDETEDEFVRGVPTFDSSHGERIRRNPVSVEKLGGAGKGSRDVLEV